ncbi:hypothetical protein R50073_33200 [Maricurvus nonylphenolicus]|uniref:putative bifunctional diguanylate cyclase/phosphodiesterase n=1 Tax=Maricurvus nonylphenolicus TaxID=1008307 RepID=UPI0036F23267
MSEISTVLNVLGIVAFEKTTEGNFSLLHDQPDWFTLLYSNAIGQSQSQTQGATEFDLALAFPYVENFLEDACEVWNKDTSEQILSGIWTETLPGDDDMQLEARACKHGSSALLIIENKTASFAEQHAVYQKARNIALTNERLLSELNSRQRQLQSELERNIHQRMSLEYVSDAIQRDTSAVMICQPDGNVEIMNKALVDIYQMDDCESLRSQSLLDKWLKEAQETYPEINRVLKAGAYWEGEFESLDSRQRSRWIRLTIGPVRNDSGDVQHYVCVANDISEFRSVGSTSSDNLVDYDFTTHLPNRRHFWKHLKNVIETVGEAAVGIAILYIDLDYFKRVNDRLGHSSGDFLLSTIASRIARGVKSNDYVAHLGGDEFVVIAQYINNAEDGVRLAERILSVIKEPLALSGESFCITASIGISYSTAGSISASDMLKNADLAMYSAKELGRNQVRLFTETLSDTRPRRLQREHEIQDAIDQDQFLLLMQPQISIHEESLFRVEALIRWQHPQEGMLSPLEFIPIAEDCGLIIPLGRWVLRYACTVGLQLLEQGIPLFMAVNVSTKQLNSPDFLEDVRSALEKTGYPATNLELEITESSFLEDMDGAIAKLQTLRNMGISISLDDFGTGFSSLHYLRKLPIDYLKIDRSFISTLDEDRESKAITASVIKLAHTLNIKVIAEGVEQASQLALLTQWNCDLAQGFYFHRPLSVQAIEELYYTKYRAN